MSKLENTVIDFGFRPKTKSRGDELVALWNLARANAENGPACPCHGIYAGRIDPDTRCVEGSDHNKRELQTAVQAGIAATIAAANAVAPSALEDGRSRDRGPAKPACRPALYRSDIARRQPRSPSAQRHCRQREVPGSTCSRTM